MGAAGGGAAGLPAAPRARPAAAGRPERGLRRAVRVPGPGLLGLALGVLVWVLAGADLARMRDGRMDPSGRASAEVAREYGLLGGLLSLGGWAFWAVLLLLPYPALPR